MALDIILRLDLAQESRSLSNEERDLQSKLKKRLWPLLFWRERERDKALGLITLLKEGDANTRFFHLRVNHKEGKKLSID